MELFYYLYCTALCEGALHVHCANCISVSAIELSIINTSGNSWESDLGVHSQANKMTKETTKSEILQKNRYFIGKNTHTHINFIYSVDRIIDFDRAEPTCYRSILRQFRLTKCSFFIHINTPNIHPRLDLNLELFFRLMELFDYSRITWHLVHMQIDTLCVNW